MTALASAVLRVIFLPTIGDESRGTGLAVLSAAFPFPASAVADLFPDLFPLGIAEAGGRYCDTVRDGKCEQKERQRGGERLYSDMPEVGERGQRRATVVTGPQKESD